MIAGKRVHRHKLRCMQCGLIAHGPQFFPCTACGGTFEVDIGLPTLSEKPTARPSSIWEYYDLLPEVPPAARISLGEGGSPLIETSLGGQRVFLKTEGVSPTLSFKDRYSAVNVSVAKGLGYAGIVLSSTGNAGLAAATYAAAGSIEARVIVPPETPRDIQRAIPALGADLRVAPRKQHADMVLAGMREGLFPGSRSHPWAGTSAYGVEGYKTIAYETYAALGMTPDVVYVPMGSGDGLYGISKGFSDLVSLGHANHRPRMIGVASRARMALSIAGDQHGSYALGEISKTGGRRLTVDEAALLDAMRRLAALGILAEPAAAASAAGFLQDATRGVVYDNSLAVCVITSSLAKWWQHVPRGVAWPTGSF